MNDPTVEQLFCCLEGSEDSTENGIAALGRIVQLSKEARTDENDLKAEKAYSEHVTMFEEYISSIEPADTKGKKRARPRNVTKVRHIRRKRLGGKPKRGWRSIGPCSKNGRPTEKELSYKSSTVPLTRQIDPEVIEGTCTWSGSRVFVQR